MRYGALLLGLLLFCGPACAVPPPPSSGAFVADYGATLNPTQKASLSSQVREQNARSSSHLYVVTVKQLDSKLEKDIQEAARGCFESWGMADGDVLLLLSLQERTARIQLGSAWGLRWDLEMQRIMRDVVVPASQEGDYARALSQATTRLLVVTAAGPTGSVPARNTWEKLENLAASAARRSHLPWQMCLVFMISGTTLLLIALLPIGSSPRIFAAGLGVYLWVSSLNPQGVLTFMWVAVGLGLLWVCGSAIQAGFQSGASLAGLGGSPRDDDQDFVFDRDSDRAGGSFESLSSSGTSSSGSSESGGATGSW